LPLWRALRTGHWPSLVAAWLHFEVSFMAWVLIGALGVFISRDLGLSATQKGVMVAIPLLGGAIARIFVGIFTDMFGSRKTGVISMLFVTAPLALGWLDGHSFSEMIMIGALLGIAGASFAVALPLASRAYPIEHQGLAMGVAGSGNSGAILSIALAPLLAERLGWHAVFGLMLPVVVVLAVIYWSLAKDHAQPLPRMPPRVLRDLVREPDTGWLCFLYSITFGGFVGLSSYLSIFFVDQYGLTPIQAGWAAGACALAGSFFRPVGGFMADRLGGLRVLTVLYPIIALLSAFLALLLPITFALPAVFFMMACLGMGNGVIFQVVPQRFLREIGTMSGIIGAAGGLGGFLVPSVLGLFKDLTGSFSTGFALYVVVCALAMPAIQQLRRAKAVNTLSAI
jgi:NNP family nitrate/nitrite transporter-like MFS transporter